MTMDIKKMNGMVTELKAMKIHLFPDEPDSLHEAELKEMDPFTRIKTQLNDILRPLSKEVDRLGELRSSAPEGRDRNTIALFAENSKNLQQAAILWQQLKTLIQKEETKKGIDEKTISDRKKLVTILGTEIKDITNRNNHVSSSTVRAHESKSLHIMRDRKEERERKRGRRQQGENRDESNKEKDNKSADIEIDGEVHPIQVSVEDQKFFDEVEDEKRNQDKMLDELIVGLTDLQDLAGTIRIDLVASNELIKEIDDEAEKLNQKFKGSNKRLQDMLEEMGGVTRWCPMLICVVLLIALIGYMYNMLKS